MTYEADNSLLQLRLLGTPQLLRESQIVELTAAKPLALLAYLALSATPQPRERLIGLLWAESSEEAARKNLRNVLWTIRRTLGENAILSSGDRIALNAAVSVDVATLGQLATRGAMLGPETALTVVEGLYHTLVELWRGPLLDGVVLVDAPEFEIWLLGERERLQQMQTQLLQQIIAASQAQNAWLTVIAAAQRVIAADPLQEPMYRALMDAHARRGERAEALHQYDMLRGVLERELGVAPLPETEALRQAIVGGSVGPRKIAASLDVRRLAPPVMGELSPLPLVGRQAERAALDAALAQAQRGNAQVVLLNGPAGIGKTRLWQEWSLQLGPEIAVLAAHGTESLDSLPLLPVSELLRNSPRAAALLEARSPLAAIWLAELAQLLPEIRAAYPTLPPPAAAPPAEERRSLFEALVQVMDALSSSVLVIGLDDLHWMDTTTLDWLRYLLNRKRAAPLLVVATYRPDEASSVLMDLIGQWSRQGLARRLVLGPLTPDESAALLAAVTSDAAVLAQAQSRSVGNPLFLIELARSEPGTLPLALADLLRRRINRLPEMARQVLQAAMVLQPEIDVALLRRTSGRSEEETLDSLDTLLQNDVLDERGNRYVFSHPLFASLVRTDMSAARRAFLHRRAAEALEALHAGHLAQVAGQLAQHYAETSDTVRAAQYAELAGEQALALCANAEAVRFFQQSLGFAATPARHLGLGRALNQSGDLAGALAAFEQARAAAEAEGDAVAGARACLGIADVQLSSGDFAAVVAWAQRGLAGLPPTAEPGVRALGLFLLGAGLLRLGELVPAAQQLQAAAELAATHALPILAARSQFELGNLAGQRGDLAAAQQAMQASIQLVQQVREPFQEALSRNNAAYYALLGGDIPAATMQLEAGFKVADSWALEVPRQWLYSTRGEIALAEHQWDVAEEWFRRGTTLAEAYQNAIQVANYRANLGLVALRRGDLAGARELLEQARAAAAVLPAAYLQTQIDLWRVELYRASGEHEAAAAALHEARQRLGGAPYAQLQSWADSFSN